MFLYLQTVLRGAMIMVMLSNFFSSSEAKTETLKAGDMLPSWEAKNQDGKLVRSSDFKGKPVLIFFYPKDDTPGCTKEVCEFRDHYSTFRAAGAEILGVSRQDEASHQAFRKKFNLPFDLLIDDKGALASKMGVGTIPLLGLHKRQSLLIDGEGRFYKFYDDVDPAHHAQEVLKDLGALSHGKK